MAMVIGYTSGYAMVAKDVVYCRCHYIFGWPSLGHKNRIVLNQQKTICD